MELEYEPQVMLRLELFLMEWSIQLLKSKNNTHTILIQHGNFFTVYKNLSDIYVKKGDKLKTKDSIGKIATDPLNGQTILSFSIFNNGFHKTQDFGFIKCNL